MRDLCAVCREAGSDVSCLLCSAPHHKDCWVYSRGCSIYGCTSIHNSDQLHEFQKTYRLGLSFSPEEIVYPNDVEEIVVSPLLEGVQVVCLMIMFLAAVVFGIVCVADHVDQFNRVHSEQDEIMDVVHPSNDQATCGFIRRNSVVGLPIIAGAGFVSFLTEDGVRAFPVPNGTRFDALVASQGVHHASDFLESRD